MSAFVRRNRIILCSGLLLLLSVLLVSAGSRGQRGPDPVARLVLEVMRPLQVAVASAAGAGRRLWHSYISLVGVGSENQRLRRRIDELEQQTVRRAELDVLGRRLDELLRVRSALEVDTQAALIIGRDPLPWFGTVTINRGVADGVFRNAAVLSASGVVGQTFATTAHSARVLLITDHNSGIDAMVQRTRARGIIEGTLDARCVMKYLERAEDVVVGDRVVTSGLDGIFPKGVLIGEVTALRRGDRALLQVAEVTPSAPLDRIEAVLVVRQTVPDVVP
jgi:rod shape-determining protein MreC